jgi:long-chain fatty acid transport protein
MGMPPFAIRTVLRSVGVTLAIAVAMSDRASATGFFINQQSVRGLGRVDAGNTVVADELGTIFFNPAGLTEIWRDAQPHERIRISLGAHLIVPRGDQRNRGSVVATPGTLGALVPLGGGDAHNPTDPTPVPNLYLAAPLRNGRAAVGLGINAPFGLSTNFSPDWHGRYDAIDASLRTVNVSIVGAYRFASGLSVGGGLDLQYARTELTTAIPNPLAPGGPTAATDARIATSGHDYTPGFNVGVLYPVDEKTRVGVHYRSGMKHDISGSSEITGLPALLGAFNGVVDADAALNLPAIATVGVRRILTLHVALLGEFEWFDWSTFREVRIRFADGRPDGVRATNFRDAYAAALGAEYTLSPGWTARSGVHVDTTPTTDGFRDTTVPDSGRLWLGFGATVQASRSLSVDLAFNHVFFRDTAIALTRTFFDDTPLATSVDINSTVTSVVNTLSVDVRYGF